MKNVSAADANRHFSSVLREVAKGEMFVVVSRGKLVATIAPAGRTSAFRRDALQALLRRLESQTPAGVRTWTREELYEDAS